jgi:hypothetical protein
VCDLEHGARSPLHRAGVDAGAGGISEHLADHGLAPLGGRVRPRPLRIARPAAGRPVGEPVSQLLAGAVQIVSRSGGKAGTWCGPDGGRARPVAWGGRSRRRVAGDVVGAGQLGGFLADAPRQPDLAMVRARGRRRGGHQPLVVEVRAAEPSVLIPVTVPGKMRAPRCRRVLADEDLPPAHPYLWPQRARGARVDHVRNAAGEQLLALAVREHIQHELAHPGLLMLEQRRVARRRRRRATGSERWIGRGCLGERLRAPYNTPPRT